MLLNSDVSIELRYFTNNSMDFGCNETGNINPITFSSGRFKWLSDLNLFQRFVTEILNLKGRWIVPRGGCKQLKTDDITIRPRSHGTGSVWSPYQFDKFQDEHDS